MDRLAILCFAIGAAIAAVALSPQVQARSAEALAVAEKVCFDQGIKPHSTAFEKCVERVADAYYRTGQIPKLTWPTASVGPEKPSAISQS